MQRAQYNGHKRRHAFKAHAVISPSGMVVHYFGPVEGRHHDSWLLRESGLYTLVATLTINGVDYQIYADSAYPVMRNLVPPIPRSAAPSGSAAASLNTTMSGVRIVSEWWYQIQTNTFQTMDFSRWQRQFLTLPSLQYHVGMLLVNCRTCMLSGNRISKYFGVDPPSLDEYLAGSF